ncbi:SUMF1/EgtB/PvdO family nonheme iron enzyme [Methylocapsa sp. S129]|uniref:SUMF1/EgtB/PvdO family nonheme iron enzyme n=1 Tax=Methylocapsa sp. S129 TaxID=1641869 RepID=UPI00131CB006|nr:SUMF1/EgtB/PvdO family nonheme iron enzyme [Methylocapsa sp. S129]
MIASDCGRMSVGDLEERIDAIDNSAVEDFVELIRLAGLNPTYELRFGDFSGCRFDGQDLRGFGFTGCDLTNASFKGARIERAEFDCATMQLATLAEAADFDNYLKTEMTRRWKSRFPLNARRLRDLAIFREAPFAPEMVVLPAGEFAMGSALGDAELPEDDKARDDEIAPGLGKRRTRIPRRFAMARYPVTFEEYDVFTDATGRKRVPHSNWGRARRPAINLSWSDAQAYVAWLNGKLGGKAYRLPSEAEWEYACRAGTDTRRWWGDAWDAARANGARSFEGGRTSPVGHFAPNDWQLHDMIGNVWEWCADEWADNIAKLPEDGAAFGKLVRETHPKQIPDVKKNKNRALRALRGGSWYGDPRGLRSANRGRCEPGDRFDYIGFRLSRTL